MSMILDIIELQAGSAVKTLENFLWDVDQYFKAVKVPDTEQVPLVGMYLTGDAKLWWLTR